jgi:hypothetical protein
MIQVFESTVKPPSSFPVVLPVVLFVLVHQPREEKVSGTKDFGSIILTRFRGAAARTQGLLEP